MSSQNEKSLSGKKISKSNTPKGAKSSNQEPVTFQVIHQLIIPEKPTGLIGEKVVYGDKWVKYHEKKGTKPHPPLPECGYFTITKTIFREDGNVMVGLHPHNGIVFNDGTHLCIAHLKPYKAD